MSKRYSGKSFKDSTVKKKPKFNLKEKRKLKKKQAKKSKLNENSTNSQLNTSFLSFKKKLNMYNNRIL